MPIKNPDNFNYLTWICLLLISMFGACARYIFELQRNDTSRFKWTTLLANMFIAIFCGVLAASISSHFDLNAEVAGGIAGMAGWGGAEFIKKITKFNYKKIGVCNDIEKNK